MRLADAKQLYGIWKKNTLHYIPVVYTSRRVFSFAFGGSSAFAMLERMGYCIIMNMRCMCTRAVNQDALNKYEIFI